MSRIIPDSNYYASRGGTVPIKWTAPEVNPFMLVNIHKKDTLCIIYSLFNSGSKLQKVLHCKWCIQLWDGVVWNLVSWSETTGSHQNSKCIMTLLIQTCPSFYKILIYLLQGFPVCNRRKLSASSPWLPSKNLWGHGSLLVSTVSTKAVFLFKDHLGFLCNFVQLI